MNIKKNSLGVKTFTYLIIFSACILLLLWFFQIGFLKVFYERYQVKKIEQIASNIINNQSDILNNLETTAYNNEICIDIYTDNKNLNYNTLNKDCILNSNNVDIKKIKHKIINSSKETLMYKVENPSNNSKSLIYGINLNNNTHIILNTKLEDVGTTTNVLTNQLIYITLITIILSIVVSFFVSKMLNKPIINITKKARLMAEGNYEKDNIKYNIAELDELNDVLNYACTEIKNTDELRRDLMANVSHDLKTPLTMIKAYAEMARDINNNNEEKRTDNLNIIIDEADRLNILVNDILDLSKLQNNSSNLKLEDYDLIEEINSILNRYQIIKETENYNIVLNAPNIAVVHADKTKINNVLYNLINNAINYTGKDLTVKINITEKKNTYLVEIIDTGKGIDKENLKLIWSKYYKNEKNHQRNVVGTGLGLSIVKEVLTKHKFNYGVKSKKDKGSNFYFEIDKAKIS